MRSVGRAHADLRRLGRRLTGRMRCGGEYLAESFDELDDSEVVASA